MPVIGTLRLPTFLGEPFRGSSTLPGHEGEIEIYGISVGYNRSYLQSGSPPTVAPLGPVTIWKAVDDATPQLMDFVVNGPVLTGIDVFMFRDSGAGPFEYLHYDLQTPRWQGHGISPSTSFDTPGGVVERLQLQSDMASIRHVEERSDGSAGRTSTLSLRTAAIRRRVSDP